MDDGRYGVQCVVKFAGSELHQFKLSESMYICLTLGARCFAVTVPVFVAVAVVPPLQELVVQQGRCDQRKGCPSVV